MSDCGCFYCKECYRDSERASDFDRTCIVCGQPRQACFDLRDKNQLKAVESKLVDPIQALQNGLESLALQDNQNKKYISWLEKLVCDLKTEKREVIQERDCLF